MLYRLHELQVIKQEQFVKRMANMRQGRLAIYAARGNILDSEGAPLVSSIGTWELYADPSYMEDKLTATVSLSRILGTPRAELRDAFESRRNGKVIAENITDTQAEQIGELGLGNNIYLRRSYKRVYANGG